MKAPASHHAPESTTLLARLGGTRKLDALVGAFYFNVVNDERVAGFFADVDIGRLLRHQRKFLAVALGGERQYSGRSLRAAHRRLVTRHALADAHFDAFVEVLAGTLKGFGYADDVIAEVMAVLESFRGEVLGRS